MLDCVSIDSLQWRQHKFSTWRKWKKAMGTVKNKRQQNDDSFLSIMTIIIWKQFYKTAEPPLSAGRALPPSFYWIRVACRVCLKGDNLRLCVWVCLWLWARVCLWHRCLSLFPCLSPPPSLSVPLIIEITLDTISDLLFPFWKFIWFDSTARPQIATPPLSSEQWKSII